MRITAIGVVRQSCYTMIDQPGDHQKVLLEFSLVASVLLPLARAGLDSRYYSPAGQRARAVILAFVEVVTRGCP